MHFL
jgi:hypothetical protein